MWDQILQSLHNITSLHLLVFLFGGVLLGAVVGVLPALGPSAGMALLLPFVFGLDPVSALALMIGMLAVIPTGDTFTSVLIGVPGSVASQATVLDGYPLSRQGHAARALGAAFGSSLVGGLFGALLLSGFVLIARPVILAMGAGELFMLCLLGLSMVGVLSGRSLTKGLAACGLGLALGAVGGAPATAELRMDFGLIYLMDGLPIAVVALAIFAVPEIIDLIRHGRPISRDGQVHRGLMQGVRDVFRNIGLVLRCSWLGAAIGVVPGLGSSVSDWVAYGHAVQTAKDKSQFGKGDIRGVLAPESANNATTGGALIPTLLFGIPGSSSMAMFLGGMALIGLQPGPRMLESSLDLTYTIIWALALANVGGAALCLLISRPMALTTRVRFDLFAPYLLILIFIAAYQSSRSWGDLVALLVLGAFGIYMRRFGWSRPAFLMGFVLSGSVETYLYQSIQIYGWDWVQRPGVILIALLTVASCYAGLRFIRTMRKGGEAGPVGTYNRLPQIVFGLFVLLVLVLTLYDGARQSMLGGVFPIFVACVTLPLLAAVLVQMIRGGSDSPVLGDEDREPGREGARINSEYVLLWLGALLGLVWLLGFPAGAGLFVAVFLWRQASVALPRAVLAGLLAVAITVIWTQVLMVRFPAGLLGQVVALPTWLR